MAVPGTKCCVVDSCRRRGRPEAARGSGCATPCATVRRAARARLARAVQRGTRGRMLRRRAAVRRGGRSSESSLKRFNHREPLNTIFAVLSKPVLLCRARRALRPGRGAERPGRCGDSDCRTVAVGQWLTAKGWADDETIGSLVVEWDVTAERPYPAHHARRTTFQGQRRIGIRASLPGVGIDMDAIRAPMTRPVFLVPRGRGVRSRPPMMNSSVCTSGLVRPCEPRVLAWRGRLARARALPARRLPSSSRWVLARPTGRALALAISS